MTPYEYTHRDVGPISLVDSVTFSSGYDPDYYAKIAGSGGSLDYDYFQKAGVFSKPNPSQGKLAGDKGKALSDESGGTGGHAGQGHQDS